MSVFDQWRTSLSSWAIPEEIIRQAPVSPWIHPVEMFVVPQTIQDSPSHQAAREALPSGGCLLDIGCGGGVAAFGATRPGDHVIGVDHQTEMLVEFEKEAAQRGLTSQTFFGDWPDISDQVPEADVVTCHHVVYNVSAIEDFVRALSSHARKRVVLELPQTHPRSNLAPAFKHFWNLDSPTEPTSEMMRQVLVEMGIKPEVQHWSAPFTNEIPFELNVEFTRIRLCLPQSRDAEVAEFLKAHPTPTERALTTIYW